MLGGQSRNDVVVLGGQRREHAGQAPRRALASRRAQVHVAVGEVGRQQVEPVVVGALDPRVDVASCRAPAAPPALDLGLDAQEVGARALRIEVPQQRARPVARGEVGEVHRRRGLPHAALDVVGGEDHEGRSVRVNSRSEVRGAAIDCPRCGTDNVPGAKFCTECGSSLASACPSCGHSTTPGQNFCADCGAALAPGAATTQPALRSVSDSARASGAAPTPAPSQRDLTELRTVSVLFVDLVGYTSLSERLDPEDVRDLLGHYFDAARRSSTATAARSRSSSATRSWPYGAPRWRARTTSSARCGPRWSWSTPVAALRHEVHAPELQARAGVVTGPGRPAGPPDEGWWSAIASTRRPGCRRPPSRARCWSTTSPARSPRRRSPTRTPATTSSRARPSRSTCGGRSRSSPPAAGRTATG